MKQILPQKGRALHCLFPPQYLLLPAPRIAGLLPACVPSPVPQITVFKAPLPKSSLDRQRTIWAAQDAELQEFLVGARQRILAAFAEGYTRTCARSAQSAAVEVCHAP